MLKKYDETSPESIEMFARQMIGKTFRGIYEAATDTALLIDKNTKYAGKYAIQHATKNYKGGMGNLVEECYFGYASNSDSEPDFAKAGVELKVTPYKKNKTNNKVSAKERLIITMIDYFAVVQESSFETSHVWKKSRLILLVWYLYEKDKTNLDFSIDFVRLFTPPPEDFAIMNNDYDKIVSKIRAGKAHELSEGDTMYLGAATKSSDSTKRRAQPFSDEVAKPRAFSFKNSYMTYILNTYFIVDHVTYEPIIHDTTTTDFEQYVIDKIDRYKGASVPDLCKEFQIDTTKKPKNLEAMIAFRILGIKGNHAEEFEKANIVVKTIRINAKGKIKENMSFPAFKFKDLLDETWDDSTFGNYLRETRFFFVIYKFGEDGTLRLEGCQFWNIPYQDLETDVKDVWEKTKQVIFDGLKITKDAKGYYHNNFPKQSENRISHVRPHAQNRKDTYELPDGRQYPKQCFWLNNSYILSQIKLIQH
jgi:DNA mismatch repair protein MutH